MDTHVGVNRLLCMPNGTVPDLIVHKLLSAVSQLSSEGNISQTRT